LETFKAVTRYLGTVVAFVFPGIFILDTVLHKGLFSGGVRTAYDFILIVVWAVGLSVPYVFLPMVVFNLDPEILRALQDEKGGDEIEAEVFNLLFPLPIAFAVVHFLAYRISVATWTAFPPEVLGISKAHCLAVLSLFVILLLQYPATKVFLGAIKRAAPK